LNNNEFGNSFKLSDEMNNPIWPAYWWDIESKFH
jgi:hypothetical protein